jgi:HD-GYP domain-containing protein (c-di-GMP phosphodiesterase class II)
MVDQRPGEVPASVEQLMALVSAAINTRALYAPGHPRVVESTRRVIQMSNALAERGRDSVTFLVIGDELLIDQKPMRTGSPLQVNFVQTLRRRKVQRLTLARGLEEAEFVPFAETMVLGGVPRSSAHLVVGQVEVGEGGGVDEPAPAASREAGQESEVGTAPAEIARALEMLGARVQDVKEAFDRLRTGEEAGLSEADGLVWGFIEALAKSASGTLPLATLRAHDEYTFVHSVNVCLLTLLQARWFGFQGPMLHAIGLAALLHDIGKLFIPHTVLARSGRLSEEEWRVQKAHAEVGAWYLAGIESTAPLTILVAFEHHLRYDGLPNYPLLRTPRRPTLASQMTAVSDAYDAMLSLRPDRKDLSRPAALEILRRRAGSFYDPLIVGNFLQLLSTVGDAV